MKKQKQVAQSDQQVIDIDKLIDEMPEVVLRTLHDRIVNRLNADNAEYGGFPPRKCGVFSD